MPGVTQRNGLSDGIWVLSNLLNSKEDSVTGVRITLGMCSDELEGSILNRSDIKGSGKVIFKTITEVVGSP